MNFEQEFRLQFGDKYGNLNLKSVVAKKNDGSVTITFLYPSTDKELSDQEKHEITSWLKSKLDLEKMNLKVKFLRVFVEERLILKAIQEFFDKKYRLVSTYTNEKSFKVTITPIDVQVEIVLSSRLKTLFEEHDIAGELAKFLKANFLVDFVVKGTENANLIDEVDIEGAEIRATYKVTKRFKVQILEDVAGTPIRAQTVREPAPKEILNEPAVDNEILQSESAKEVNEPENVEAVKQKTIQKRKKKVENEKNDKSDELIFAFPEKIVSIHEPKQNVLVAGFIRKIERRDFVIKKGKKVGQSKAYYPITLQDERGKIECVFFCAKIYEHKMESLAEGDYILAHGNVRTNQMGKLQLVIDKIAKARPVEMPKEKEPLEYVGPVVVPEKITALEQNFMFDQKSRYNRKIMGRKIVVFDVETTGLDRERDQIIELGAVKIDNGNIIERFSTFVKPTKHIPYDVTKLTGITEEMVADAPPIEFVIRDFYNFSKDCVLCGHNIIDFDIHFVRREGKALGLDFDNEIIDTLNEARVARLKTSRFNLGTVTKLLGISLEGAHRAWNDAYATAQVLLKLNMA